MKNIKLNFDFENEELDYRNKKELEVKDIVKNAEILAETMCEACSKERSSHKSSSGLRICSACKSIIDSFNATCELSYNDGCRSSEILEQIFETDYQDLESWESKIANEKDISVLMSIVAGSEIDMFYRETAMERATEIVNNYFV